MQDSNNIALSSRVRLARNMDAVPFPGHMSIMDVDTISSKAVNAFAGADFEIMTVADLPTAQRQAFIEKHLASPALMENEMGMLILSKDESVAVMVGEEDHFRIQSITPGFSLEQALQASQGVDAMLGQSMDFAYSDRLGYLTTCPTNVGTGMRASVMVHLPALTMMGQMGRLQKQLHDAGMTVRGIYGEGSHAMGCIYQISNRITLGKSETQLADGVARAVGQMIKQENEGRMLFAQDPPNSVEDGVYRAHALLASARRMGHKEFMKLWSDAMLGAGLGWVQLDTGAMVALLVSAQPGMLTLQHGHSNETEITRADLCREAMRSATQK